MVPAKTQTNLKNIVTVTEEEQTFNAGLLGGDEYARLSGYAPVSDPKLIEDFPQTSIHPHRRRRVIIIGGGVNGIQQATVLLRSGHIKHEDMVIFETMSEFGGTWVKNSYPGCACDVPSMVYTTSYYISKSYRNFFPKRDEILRYYHNFARDYQLDRCTRFNSLVRSCVWDEDRMIWHVGVADKAGKVEHWACDVLIHCTGNLDRPKYGNTPGREMFKGDSWHTADWRHDYDLTGKTVAVVAFDGVYAQPTSLHTACLFRLAMKWIPYFPNLVRASILWPIEKYGMRLVTENDKLNEDATQKAHKQLEQQVKDPVLREKLRPTAKYWCKRVLLLDTFYPALSKPNCTVLRDHLVSYTEDGIISVDKTTGKQEERKYDVVIYGTGFNNAQYLEHITVRGVDGADIHTQWKDHPEALYGLAVSRFPNMFMCFGPNSVGFWSSPLDTWQKQAEFNAMAIGEIIRREKQGKKFAMCPNRRVEEEYNQLIQKNQERYTWANPSCHSYYKNDEGWITFTMPWSHSEYHQRTHKINWEEWNLYEKPLPACKL
ncbi:hypothetical protein CLAIMM_11909 [Cladophialophora immunda]|nr:hypothetical protein CLAIMM_11909 [Cladophialophora immunda]